MSKDSVTFSFGDVIEYDEEKYIFLVPSLRYVYIAKILSDFETKQIIKMREIHFNRSGPQDEFPTYWIVRLTCEDFKDQVASFTKAQRSVIYSRFFRKLSSYKLSEKDLKALKEEILKKKMWPELKELVKDIAV